MRQLRAYFNEPIRATRWTLVAVAGLALAGIVGGWPGLLLVILGIALVAIDYWIENR